MCGPDAPDLGGRSAVLTPQPETRWEHPPPRWSRLLNEISALRGDDEWLKRRKRPVVPAGRHQDAAEV